LEPGGPGGAGGTRTKQEAKGLPFIGFVSNQMTRRLWTTSDRNLQLELIGLERFETQILFLSPILDDSRIRQLDTTVKMGLSPSTVELPVMAF
jgi:hypothetical protein